MALMLVLILVIAGKNDRVQNRLGIARETGLAATSPGWQPIIALMTVISLNLGIFNLLPVPILDGGVILLLLIESVLRHVLDQKFKERIYQGAFVLLLLFAGLLAGALTNPYLMCPPFAFTVSLLAAGASPARHSQEQRQTQEHAEGHDRPADPAHRPGFE